MTSPQGPVSPEDLVGPNRRQRIFSTWATDILIYTVVLNLFVEYSTVVVIDSFTISVLMATLLKVLLVLITTAKKSLWKRARSRGSTILGVLGVWAILFLSKFLILGAEDLIFGDLVELGGFVDVMILSAALVVIREAVERLYLWLGRSEPTSIDNSPD